MISSEVLVALITGATAVIVNYIIQRADRARLDQKTADRLDALEKKIDKHNGYADKFQQISVDIAEIRTTLKHMEK